MIIKCSACSTRYLVDPKVLGATGRLVRCAKCGQSWYEAPSETVADLTPPPERAHMPVRPRTDRLRPIPRGSNLPAAPGSQSRSDLMGWMVLIAVVTLLVTGIVSFRDSIAEAWPPSKKLYDILGLEVGRAEKPQTADDAIKPGTRFLSFRDINITMESANNRPVLIVRGEIANAARRRVPVPRINATLFDSDKNLIYEWSFEPPLPELGALGYTPFETRVDNPPEAVSLAELAFAHEE